MRIRTSIVVALMAALFLLYLSTQPMHFSIVIDYSPAGAPPSLTLKLPEEPAVERQHAQPKEQAYGPQSSLRAEAR